MAKISKPTEQISTQCTNNDDEIISITGNSEIINEILTNHFEAKKQADSLAGLPHIKKILLMPDFHKADFVPVGTVIISSMDGNIYPQLLGGDIGCGMRLVRTGLNRGDLSKKALQGIIFSLETALNKNAFKPDMDVIKNIFFKGESGLTENSSDPFCNTHDEYSGQEKIFNYADDKAFLKKAQHDFGTVGKGNHFIEFGFVDYITDKPEDFLNQGEICIIIHTGSRTIGQIVSADFYRVFNKIPHAKGIIAAEPFQSKKGQCYFENMKAMLNYASASRAYISRIVQNILNDALNRDITLQFQTLYDNSHNHVRVENYNGEDMLVHRKGASVITEPEEPYILPTSLGNPSYILKPGKNIKEAYNSLGHGCGRLMSKNQALHSLKLPQFEKEMKHIAMSYKSEDMLHEAQSAYKPAGPIVAYYIEAGLAEPLAYFHPIASYKETSNVSKTQKTLRNNEKKSRRKKNRQDLHRNIPDSGDI